MRNIQGITNFGDHSFDLDPEEEIRELSEEEILFMQVTGGAKGFGGGGIGGGGLVFNGGGSGA